MTPRGTIVAFAPGRWAWPHFAGSPRYHLWSLAGLGWQVLYVEPPTSFQRRSRWRAPDREFHVLRPRTLMPFRFGAAPNQGVLEPWANAAGKCLVKEAARETKRLRWAPDIVWLGAPWHISVARHLSTDRPVVHHVYDELSESPARAEWQQQAMWQFERKLHARCDLLLASSMTQLHNRDAKWKELLGNAVADDFIVACENSAANQRVAPSLPLRTRDGQSRIAYGGVVDHRLDADWFQALEDAFPEEQMLFLGKVDASCPERLHKLRSSSNVFFSGDISYRTFPSLYAECDVLVFAHTDNAFTRAMYPEKLNEYLATGKPIVARGLPNVRWLAKQAAHPNAIRVAASQEEFVRLVGEAMEDKDSEAREARVRLAKEHSWSVEAARLDSFLGKLLSR